MDKLVLTFEQWLEKLNEAAKAHGHGSNLVGTTGVECWRDYYLGGYTPEDALLEDLSNG